MKKIVLVFLLCQGLFLASYAQMINSDGQFVYNIRAASSMAATSSSSTGDNELLVDENTVVCDSSSISLKPTAANLYTWYSDSAGTNIIAKNEPLVVDSVLNDTTFYFKVEQGDAPLPEQQATHSGNTRGYWFTAPVDFEITGLSVPKDASSGDASLAVLRFKEGPPPEYSETTDSFDILGYWTGVSEDTLTTSIFINKGEVVGILGNRGGVNSYGENSTSMFSGYTTEFMRMGMQYALETTSPKEIWQESDYSNISRIQILYSIALDSIPAKPVSITKAAYTYSDAYICPGDSLMIDGEYKKEEGVYTADTLSTIHGCDSILGIRLHILQILNGAKNYTLCIGDSVMLGGEYRKTAGDYNDTINSFHGCDSIVVTTVIMANLIANNTDWVICPGDSVYLEDDYRKTEGVYYDTVTSSWGCDSVVATSLTIASMLPNNVNWQICPGDSIYLEGAYRDTAGIYHDTLTSYWGCDSVVFTDLTIGLFETTQADMSICYGDSVLLEGSYRDIDGVYTDTVISTWGCDSVVVTTLTVNSQISTSVEESGGTLSAEQGGGEYQWFTCDGDEVSGATSQAFAATTSGSYKVSILVNSCEVTSECYTVAVTGIIENTLGNITIYPNPTDGKIQINFGEEMSNITADIYDLSGKVVLTKVTKQGSSCTLDVPGPSGYYLINIENNKGRAAVVKILKK